MEPISLPLWLAKITVQHESCWEIFLAKHHCWGLRIHFLSLPSSCSTGIDTIHPACRIGYWWLFGPLHLCTAYHLYGYVFGFQLFDFSYFYHLLQSV